MKNYTVLARVFFAVCWVAAYSSGASGSVDPWNETYSKVLPTAYNYADAFRLVPTGDSSHRMLLLSSAGEDPGVQLSSEIAAYDETTQSWSMAKHFESAELWDVRPEIGSSIIVAGTRCCNAAVPDPVLVVDRVDLNSGDDVELLHFIPPGMAKAAGRAVAECGNDLYAGGRAANEAGQQFWLLMHSSDLGITWEITDQFSLGGIANENRNILCLDNGAVLASGIGTDSAGLAHVLVRRWDPALKTWSTIADSHDPTRNTALYNFRALSFGIVAPIWRPIDPIHPEKGFDRWLLQSSDQGATWNEIPIPGFDPVTPGFVVDVNEDESGTLWATDYSVMGTEYGQTQRPWRVLNSTDQGKTWSLAEETFATQSSSDDLAAMPVATLPGKVFVGGTYRGWGSHQQKYLVRELAH